MSSDKPAAPPYVSIHAVLAAIGGEDVGVINLLAAQIETAVWLLSQPPTAAITVALRVLMDALDEDSDVNMDDILLAELTVGEWLREHGWQ